MKKKFSSKKSAFSLIELSIVLIIIGLLVAGVTGGSALIKNAEMRSVITQSQGYQAGVSALAPEIGAGLAMASKAGIIQKIKNS
jgi:prepilin-type N-terminal cleavage/methylation domain-containing protein